ncbi:hypothetical protein B9Z55_012129 [Caenorhabditis nigoni]|uniref:Uncharacterized protein n=1 Tax=Caenorhabditis nigoni TaxID=1611254 RepID=A0A2G5TVX7_9PELO|nr:hypothetical protein B9Z55_012129 [Caenorhabditis nigoni]
MTRFITLLIPFILIISTQSAPGIRKPLAPIYLQTGHLKEQNIESKRIRRTVNTTTEENAIDNSTTSTTSSPNTTTMATMKAVVITGEEDLVPRNEEQQIDLSGVDADPDSTQNDPKIETKVADDSDAPKIVLPVRDPLVEPTEMMYGVGPDGPEDDEDYQDSLDSEDVTSSEAPREASASSEAPISNSTYQKPQKIDVVKNTTTEAPVVILKKSQEVGNSTWQKAPEKNSTSKSVKLTTPKASEPTDVKNATSEYVKIEKLTTPETTSPGNSTLADSDDDAPDDDAPVEFPYHLPTDDDDNDTFVDKPFNGDVYPQTLYDQTNIFLHEFSRNHPGASFVLVCTLAAIIVLLVAVVLIECCKSRRRHRAYRSHSRTPPSVTADLYNTSACSHFYSKPTLLPNQQEVTMQLVSSDISSDMI